MINFFIKRIVLHVDYSEENIRKLFYEGYKKNFSYSSFFSDSMNELSIQEATKLAQEGEYEFAFKKWFPKTIGIKKDVSHFNIWFHDEDGLLSLSIDADYPDKQFEDEWAVYPDSHYYLRQALKLCAPFCIKSIETITMD